MGRRSKTRKQSGNASKSSRPLAGREPQALEHGTGDRPFSGQPERQEAPRPIHQESASNENSIVSGGGRVSLPHALFASVFLLCAVVLLWYITDGNWRFAEPQWFTSYYDAVAERLLEGRLDVPAADLDHEVFLYQGKTYGYFGPTPALPRIFLNAMFPDTRGQWTRTLMWLTAVATLALNAALLSYCGFSRRSRLALAYFVTAALGSTLLFVTSWAITYQEAMSWGVMLAVASLYSLLRYLREPRIQWLAAASLAAGFSFFARNATGAGPLLAVGIVTALLWFRPALLDPDRASQPESVPAAKRPFSHKALPAAILLACLATYGAINYFKFGSTFEALPIRYHAFYKPEQLAKIHGTLIHPEGAPRLLLDYLLRRPGFRKSFPWVVFSAQNLVSIDWLLHKPLLAGAEVNAGVLVTMPAMFLLAILGVSVGLRNQAYRVPLRLLLLTPLVGVGVLVSITWISQRYVHEFYPFVAVSAPFGLRWLADREPPQRARGYAILAVLMVWSLAANPLLALHWQREGSTWGCTPDCAYQYKEMREGIDRFILGRNPG